METIEIIIKAIAIVLFGTWFIHGIINDHKENKRFKRMMLEADNNFKRLTPITWVKYDEFNPDTYPNVYGKYIIVRKDGKYHFETWNGSGWAYNGNVIRYWGIISLPDEFSHENNHTR